MGRFWRACHRQNRIPPTERVGHGFPGQRVGHPDAVNHQTVFVGARCQRCFFPPVPNPGGMEGFGFWPPLIECSCDTNGGGCRMREFEPNGHLLWTGVGDVVVILVMFHDCMFLVCPVTTRTASTTDSPVVLDRDRRGLTRSESFYPSGQPVFHGATLNQNASTVLLRSEEHTSELQSQSNLVCRLLLEKKKKKKKKKNKNKQKKKKNKI